jgi:glycine/D-amino acid oxidase-like deaminating enzyme
MEAPIPFRETSPWVERPADLRPALADDLSADVVVLGGGYSGLSTALALRAQGADVVLLERQFAGSGASGRNAGHLTPTIGKDIPTLLRLFGRERATALVRFADAAVSETEETIRKLGLDCEYRASGNLLAGVHPKHERRLRRAAEAAAGLGAHVRYLTDGDLRERGLPPAFRCAVLEERGGHLHPGRYAMGLRSAALAAGVRLYEESECERLEDGRRVTAHTARGRVVADAAVLATNAHTPALGWLRRTVAPLRVSLFETAPLDDATLSALDWPGREGVYTAHEVLENYRLTARNTLVGGSRIARTGFGRQLPPAYDPRVLRTLERVFRERLPVLRDVPIACFWGGWIGFTLDFLPTLGVTGRHANVFYGIGYAGHGLAQATLMGPMLAERVQGREHEWDRALRRRVLRWPPEPFRWLGGQLLIRALEAADRRTDRQIRNLKRS